VSTKKAPKIHFSVKFFTIEAKRLFAAATWLVKVCDRKILTVNCGHAAVYYFAVSM
jgi:hypothetical protein